VEETDDAESIAEEDRESNASMVRGMDEETIAKLKERVDGST